MIIAIPRWLSITLAVVDFFFYLSLFINMWRRGKKQRRRINFLRWWYEKNVKETGAYDAATGITVNEYARGTPGEGRGFKIFDGAFDDL